MLQSTNSPQLVISALSPFKALTSFTKSLLLRAVPIILQLTWIDLISFFSIHVVVNASKHFVTIVSQNLIPI